MSITIKIYIYVLIIRVNLEKTSSFKIDYFFLIFWFYFEFTDAKYIKPLLILNFICNCYIGCELKEKCLIL